MTEDTKAPWVRSSLTPEEESRCARRLEVLRTPLDVANMLACHDYVVRRADQEKIKRLQSAYARVKGECSELRKIILQLERENERLRARVVRTEADGITMELRLMPHRIQDCFSKPSGKDNQ